MEDSKLIELYWQRSEMAIDETAKKYGRYCSTIALNILSNYEDTEECISDTYFKIWNAIPNDRPNIFSAYIGKITKNLAINMYRKAKAKKRGNGQLDLILEELENCISSKDEVDSFIERKELTKLINDFLLSLRFEDRAIFVRRYWYVDSIKDIASRYDVSENRIKVRLFRCRKKLKCYLEKEEIKI